MVAMFGWSERRTVSTKRKINIEAAMPLFDVIGLGGEKHAVVIDIGAAYTK